MTAGATRLGMAGAGAAPAGGRTLADRILKRVAFAHIAAVALGAIDIFLLLWLVLPEPDLGSATQRVVLTSNAIAVSVLTPIGLVVGTWVGYRIARPIQRFIRDNRAPTEEERIVALRHPLRSAGIDAAGWSVGASLLALLNLRFSPDAAFHVGSDRPCSWAASPRRRSPTC